jgi:hypothetical protein
MKDSIKAPSLLDLVPQTTALVNIRYTPQLERSATLIESLPTGHRSMVSKRLQLDKRTGTLRFERNIS